MSFDNIFKVIKVSKDRIGVIVGKKGSVKSEIESKCNIVLDVDGETGDVTIRLKNESSLTNSGIFKASEIIMAISKGFSPERAYRLLSDDIFATTCRSTRILWKIIEFSRQNQI